MGYSEFNDFPVEMYRHSFPKHKNYGDITKIDFESLPDLDLICGGSPCQSHSRIGNGLGFDDPRGQLFFDYIRLIEVKRPKAFVFENVDSLAKGKKGAKNMELVLGSIIKAGYKPTYRFLKASDYCEVPQARERLFVIGIRNDIYDAGFRYKWPEKKPCSISFEDILDKPGEINPELFYDSDAIDSMLRMSYGTASAKKREIILGKDVELGGIIPGNIMVIGGCECGE